VKFVRHLGSQFVAFLAGAVLATGLAIIAPVLVADTPPAAVGLVLLSGLLVLVGGLLSGWASAITGDIETLASYESKASERDALWDSEQSRLRLLLSASIAAVVVGLALLPLRLILTGWDGPKETRHGGHLVGTKAAGPNMQPDHRFGRR
jgi:hypothetical protein